MANARNKKKNEDEAGGKTEPADETQLPPPPPQNHAPQSPPPSKKRKLDGEDDNVTLKRSTLPYNKHETHWNLDGSVLLQIGKIRFKVHQSRLVSESPFFRALIEQRKGVFDPQPYPYQGEIDPILARAEDVDGLDLFFLDADESIEIPDAVQFSVLLTAMNKGINFAYEPPTKEDVFALLDASCCYQMATYENFCQHYITALYPDTWLEIPDEPSIPSAVKGVLLNTSYPDLLFQIRRPAFYDLARAPLYLSSEANNEDASNAKPAKTPERKALKSLRTADMVTLLDLQKRLKVSWDDVVASMLYTCKSQACNKVHSKGSYHAMSIAKEFPYDPIIGIRKMLERAVFTSLYCSEAAKEVKLRLQAEAEGLWNDLSDWVKLNDDDSDGD